MLVFCFHSILSLDHFVFSFFPSPPFLFTLVLWGVYCISPARNCAREIIAPGLRFLPFLPPSKGIGPYSIRFRNFFFWLFIVYRFSHLFCVDTSTIPSPRRHWWWGKDLGWCPLQLGGAFLKKERRQCGFHVFSNVWSHLVWSLLQHGHHPVSFTVATYVLYHLPTTIA